MIDDVIREVSQRQSRTIRVLRDLPYDGTLHQPACSELSDFHFCHMVLTTVGSYLVPYCTRGSPINYDPLRIQGASGGTGTWYSKYVCIGDVPCVMTVLHVHLPYVPVGHIRFYVIIINKGRLK
jgi:hypothetical protein